MNTAQTSANTSLSSSAHSQREALFAINSASIAALDTDFATDAELTALSGAAEVRRNQLDTAQTAANTSLSSSAISLTSLISISNATGKESLALSLTCLCNKYKSAR